MGTNSLRLISVCLILFFQNLVFSQDTFGSVKTKDGVIYYETYGVGAPTLFLNGGPGIPSKYYKYIINEIGEHRKVILFDQRGTGRSTLTKVNKSNFKLKQMVEDIESIRSHLEIEKWDVVGQSFGGSYALHYAAEYADKINKLVLIASAGYDKKSLAKKIYLDYPPADKMLPAEKILSDSIIILNEDINRDVAHVKVLRKALRSRNYIHDLENLDAQMNWFLNLKETNPKIKRYVWLNLKKGSISNKLSEIKNKTLILYGDKDFIELNVSQGIHNSLENSVLKILNNCGHSIWFDKKVEARKIVSDFLE